MREVRFLKEMSRENFYEKIVKGVAKSEEFGSLVSFGAKNMSPAERETLAEEFSKIAPELSGKKSDDTWDDIACTIIDRAGKLR